MNAPSDNPFAPPRAAVAEVADPAPAGLLPARRPIAVWLIQAFALSMVLACGIGVLNLVESRINAPAGWVPDIGSAVAVRVSGIVFCSVVLVGCQRRRSHGRWAGLALIGSSSAWLAWHSLSASLKFAGQGSRHGESLAISAGIACVLSAVLGLLWSMGFGFSRRARASFGVAA